MKFLGNLSLKILFDIGVLLFCEALSKRISTAIEANW